MKKLRLVSILITSILCGTGVSQAGTLSGIFYHRDMSTVTQGMVFFMDSNRYNRFTQCAQQPDSNFILCGNSNALHASGLSSGQFNFGNLAETGIYWLVGVCTDHVGHYLAAATSVPLNQTNRVQNLYLSID